MYGFAHHKRTTANVASAASYSSSIHIVEMNKIAIEMPAITTQFGSANVGLFAEVAQASTDTFKRLKVQGNSAVTDWYVPATAVAYIAVCPAEGFNYLRVAFTTAATDGADVHVHRIK